MALNFDIKTACSKNQSLKKEFLPSGCKILGLKMLA